MAPLIQICLLGLSLYNVARIAVYMITSNLQTIRDMQRSAGQKSTYYRPMISIVVPAHNEGEVIVRTLESLLASNYPKSRMEVIVANDGSTDNTAKLVRSFAARNRHQAKIRLVSRPNRGKAEALNHAIKRVATGQLIMCLDADSIVHKNCIRNSVQYFKDKQVMATASNVNIIENGTMLGLAQRFEYLFSHHFKKAHTYMNMEYIIGGVGSTFRRSVLKDVSFYDSNTLTEDIDLTMKIVSLGNKKNRVVFAADAITYTEPVQTYGALIKQRFRWKYGRLQTFFKNKELFFSRDSKYSLQLTWFLLPVTLLYEVAMVFEPFILGYIIYLCISNSDISTVFLASIIFTSILVLNIWASDHIGILERIRLTLYAPAMYILLYGLAFVEYSAVMRSVWKLPNLPSSLEAKRTTWKSPARNAQATIPQI